MIFKNIDEHEFYIMKISNKKIEHLKQLTFLGQCFFNHFLSDYTDINYISCI